MADEENTIIRHQFALYPSKTKYDVLLTSTRIIICSGRDRNEDVILLDDVIGCHVLQDKKNNVTAAYLCIFSYPLRKKKLGSGVIRQRITKTFTTDSERTYQENLVVAETWKMTIKRLVAGEVIRTKEDTENGSLATRNLLVLINPFSGRKKATALYKEKVRPMFTEAEIKHTVRKTESPGHAKEMAKQLKLEDWDGIVIVSGDGLVHEVINGLMDRPDWEQAIKMPIGIVPGGSGNALAAAVVYASTGLHNVASSATMCTFEICRGRVRTLDLVAVETADFGFSNEMADGHEEDGSRHVVYSFMGTVLGLIADIDIESESLRCLGGDLRNIIYAVMRILSLRRYELEISYVPCEPGASSIRGCSTTVRDGEFYKNSRVASGSGLFCDGGACSDNAAMGDASLIRSLPLSGVCHHGGECTDRDECDKNVPVLSKEALLSDVPPLRLDIPDSWITERNRYVMVMATYVSHIAHNVLCQVQSKLNDGKIFLNMSDQTTTRRTCLRSWDRMEKGLGLSDVSDPASAVGRTVECKAFRVTPKGRSQIITVDGEVVPFGPIQCTILPGLARVMSSLPE